MNYIKKHIIRLTVLLLALQIMNLSVQSRPTLGTNDSFLLSHGNMVNPIDHMLEYVVERVMHRKNAFPEDNSNKEHRDPMQFEKTTTFNLYFSYYTIQIENQVHNILLMHRDAYTEGYDYLFASEINPPPPKA